ncbi:hypothetical protein HMPREF9069_00630 [Atopobium sp. oral taxon 810 str. F0209]|nr:hypothetical protein HMPREF9069_00630 [Atopobium sp. oral taxon 810 str. F0209]
MQTVQYRTKRLEKPQIKTSARMHIEPDVNKRVHCEPDMGERVLIEPPAEEGVAYFFRVEKKSNLLLLKLTLYY